MLRVGLLDGQHVAAVITRDAAVELGFAASDEVVLVIKATEVMLAKS